MGDLYALGMMLLNLGLAALDGGDLDESGPLFTEALRYARRIDDRVAQYLLLDALARQSAGSGEPRLAARLLGAASLRPQPQRPYGRQKRHRSVSAVASST